MPAAGLGSRFSRQYPGLPKPLIPVQGKPMLLVVLENLALTENDRVIIVARTGQNLSAKVDTSHLRGKLIYIELDKLSCGPACTVKSVLDEVPAFGNIIVLNSDQYVREGLDGFRKTLSEMERGGLIMTMYATGTRWSFVETRDDDVVEIEEKLEISDEATVGIYGWTSKDLLEVSLRDGTEPEFEVNGEYYLGPTYKVLIRKGVPVKRYFLGKMEETMAGLGTPEDLCKSLDLPWFRVG